MLGKTGLTMRSNRKTYRSLRIKSTQTIKKKCQMVKTNHLTLYGGIPVANNHIQKQILCGK